MPEMFLLSYYFLDQEHLAFVETKKTKSGIQYHVMLLTEHFVDRLMQKIIVTADAIALPLSYKIRNIIDAIKIALYNETGTGLRN